MFCNLIDSGIPKTCLSFGKNIHSIPSNPRGDGPRTDSAVSVPVSIPHVSYPYLHPYADTDLEANDAYGNHEGYWVRPFTCECQCLLNAKLNLNPIARSIASPLSLSSSLSSTDSLSESLSTSSTFQEPKQEQMPTQIQNQNCLDWSHAAISVDPRHHQSMQRMILPLSSGLYDPSLTGHVHGGHLYQHHGLPIEPGKRNQSPSLGAPNAEQTETAITSPFDEKDTKFEAFASPYDLELVHHHHHHHHHHSRPSSFYLSTTDTDDAVSLCIKTENEFSRSSFCESNSPGSSLGTWPSASACGFNSESFFTAGSGSSPGSPSSSSLLPPLTHDTGVAVGASINVQQERQGCLLSHEDANMNVNLKACSSASLPSWPLSESTSTCPNTDGQWNLLLPPRDGPANDMNWVSTSFLSAGWHELDPNANPSIPLVHPTHLISNPMGTSNVNSRPFLSQSPLPLSTLAQDPGMDTDRDSISICLKAEQFTPDIDTPMSKDDMDMEPYLLHPSNSSTKEKMVAVNTATENNHKRRESKSPSPTQDQYQDHTAAKTNTDINTLQLQFLRQKLSSTTKPDLNRHSPKNIFLIEGKRRGLSYKDIKRLGGFKEAESTLRGRFRTLTKSKEQRVRRPQWQNTDVSFYPIPSIHIRKGVSIPDTNRLIPDPSPLRSC
ncbi:hypothetical protein MPDQ_001605 [Monascus purpureus]|uniref:Uncharacterized protein n=1 Tax=Monascus purpureus TaxID=5098 RepID=A0A507QRH4_MONPU|nr:hypothetical protein MPDQ_001605 [Monascus purpureus]